MQPQRRSFLLGRVVSSTTPRPPGTLPEVAAQSACDTCARCLEACPTGIIRITDALPRLDFSAGECTFCGRCAEACPSGAILPGEHRALPLRATISPRCLAVRGVECRTCGEHCDARAIRFLPVAGRPRLPEVDLDLCTGCGACLAPCPSAAIEFNPVTETFA